MKYDSLTLAFMGPLGIQELLIIGAILLLLFGGKKIPKIAKGIASSVSEFRKGKNEYSKEISQTSKPHDH